MPEIQFRRTRDQANSLRGLIERQQESIGGPAFVPRARGMAHTLAVTSGKGGVGKSNIALNLAVALAAAERRVCLLDANLGHQAKVAQYLPNCPEYLESFFACAKAALVPVNTNYRYTGDELAYLWDNADAEAVVFHGAFTARCDELRQRPAGIRL